MLIKSFSKEKKEIKKIQRKTAKFFDFIVKEKVKGIYEDFEHRLEKKSLIVAIAGRRGSGKSALGFRILENLHAKKRPAFVLGVNQKILPRWIKSVEDIHEVKNGGVLLVDEGALTFGSRNSMSKANKELSGLLAVARHKDMTLLLITQNTAMIDKNVLNLCDTIILKQGSLLQEKMERNVMKDFYKKANEKIKELSRDERIKHAYILDDDFEGLVKTHLPSFWSDKISKNQA